MPSGGREWILKRRCNGCQAFLGDMTAEEKQCDALRLPLPDVRAECPHCSPAFPNVVSLPVEAADTRSNTFA
jgi:hypothetical protein